MNLSSSILETDVNICPLKAYAQIYSRLRVLGIKVDPKLWRNCKPCLCSDKCLGGIAWNKDVIGTRLWTTPDYYIVCMICVNTVPLKLCMHGEYF